MLNQDMFLAMILTHARRDSASCIELAVERENARIVLDLPDGSRRQVTAPPAEVLVKIIESLECGQTLFRSRVFTVQIDSVLVRRGPESMLAKINSWTIESGD